MTVPGVTRMRPFADYPFTPVVEGPTASNQGEMDRAVARVREGAVFFGPLRLDERLELIRSIQKGFMAVAQASVEASCRAKGILPGSPLEGEEWATGPVAVLRQLRLLGDSLRALKNHGNTPAGPVSETPDGRLSLRIFPLDKMDSVLFRDAAVDVRLQEGIRESEERDRRASFYKGPSRDSRVVLILGGGNVASIPVMDILTKLFNEGKVCVLKMNPINAYLGPFIEKAFRDAVMMNFLAILYGGSEEGSYLCGHDGIDEIHITGSDQTHDHIVWGPPGREREERRTRGAPLLKKKITSELGNVSPVILVPGPYSDREQSFQAEDLVGSATMNASCLCNNARVLVTPRGWPGRVPFIRHVEEMLAHVPTRRAFYPGTEERWNSLTAGRHWLRNFGGSSGGRLPWALLTWLDPENRDEPVYREESFCPVLSETSLGSEDPLDFLDRAVSFVNEILWGTLSATIVVHPRSMADPVVGAAVEEAVARLRYGTVALNAFPGVSFALASPPWGGHAGSSTEDIQSGRGWVHNTSMIEGIEKVVLRHPLTTFPKPPYFPNRRNFRTLMRRLAALERSHSWSRVPGVVFAALQV